MIKKLIKSNKILYKLALFSYASLKKLIESIRAFIYRKGKYPQALKAYKNRHNQERCFIIGTGPSLIPQDLDKLKNEYTFATHRIFGILSQTDWRPTYYVAQDTKLIEKIKDDINDIKSEKFLPINYLWESRNVIHDANYFYLNTERFYPNLPKFSEEIEKQIYEGYTVAYATLQLAIFMGFKEIYLLGVDFNYLVSTNSKGDIVKSDTAKDYFSDKINNQGINLPNLEFSYLAYKAAKKYADDNNIKIFYATRNGKLDVFEKIDFDSIY